jgi:Holliday junction DNA helicase RuvA
VGKKLAERLAMELKDKMEDMATAAPTVASAGPAADDVLSALVNLGYQRPSAQKAIETAVAKDKAVGEQFDALFRAALMAIR